MKIRRADALREYDIKENAAGRRITFSIKFSLKDGTFVFLPRAIATGLPWNVAKNRQRGVLPVDAKLESTGHIYPVGIDNLIEWNGKKVYL